MLCVELEGEAKNHECDRIFPHFIRNYMTSYLYPI